MRAISFEDIQELGITPLKCYELVDEMIRHKHDAILPAKTHIALPGNVFCNVMPSVINVQGEHWGGVKIVTRYPERIPSLDSKIILFNAESGEVVALLDGNWITAMRTGAVCAHSVRHFAVKDFSRIGMIGLGNTARASLLVLAALYPQKKLQVKLFRYKDQAEKFIERFKDFDNITFSVVNSTEELVKGSEVVISCATYFENDICADEDFDEGVLVVPVHTRGFTNCDLFFDKVYADDTGHVDHFRNFSRFKYYAEVTDVITGNAVGRTDEKERILAYNIGVSTHDVMFSSYIYQLMKKDTGILEKTLNIDMHDPKEKFWV